MSEEEKDLDLEEVPRTEVIVPDRAQVDIWKKQHPDNDIYAIAIAGETWVIRDIKREEYFDIRNSNSDPNMTPEDFELLITERCTIYPEYNFREGKAGLPSTLADMIMLVSGFEPAAAPVKL